MKRIAVLFVSAALLLSVAGCSGASQAAASTVEYTGTQSNVTAVVAQAAATSEPVVVEYDSADQDTESDSTETPAATIELAGDSITVDGTGATVDGSIVTITAAGAYSLNGVLDDGQIVVDTQDAEKVVLLLNGVDITNSWGAPIYVASAEKVVLTLAEGTETVVTDGTEYSFPDAETDEPNAAIFSEDDLTINGAGSLVVNANYNDGISSDDDLKITGGTITVNAVNDGLQGRDSVAIKNGTITVIAGGDGVVATNAEEAEQGYIVIEGGTLNITAGTDGIQAETSVTVSGGVVKVSATDDALNANGNITIDGGELTLAAGDDGVHAEASITVSAGTLTITESYEGIESNLITINDGEVRVVSSDDGINATSGAAAQGGFGGAEAASDSHLYINGGYVSVEAQGDGLDSNGSIDMIGGVVLVNGPTNSGNGALDYNGVFNITGGVLVAAGSAGMAQAPSTTSTQYSLVQTFAAAQPAGTLVHVETADGAEVVTFAPMKSFQSVVISSPDLVNGGAYVVYSGGSSTGAASGSLITGGEYTGGTQVATYTLTSVVTGANAGMMGGGMRGMRGARP